jgi:hypothetical protein
MADKVEILLYSFTDCGFYSEEDLQTYRLNIDFAVWFGYVSIRRAVTLFRASRYEQDSFSTLEWYKSASERRSWYTEAA